MLTDGAVSNPEEVIGYVRENRMNARHYSFGMGSGCDRKLVNNFAKAGRGTATTVSDGSQDLNGKVVTALSKATEPSLSDTKFGFFGILK